MRIPDGGRPLPASWIAVIVVTDMVLWTLFVLTR